MAKRVAGVTGYLIWSLDDKDRLYKDFDIEIEDVEMPVKIQYDIKTEEALSTDYHKKSSKFCRMVSDAIRPLIYYHEDADFDCHLYLDIDEMPSFEREGSGFIFQGVKEDLEHEVREGNNSTIIYFERGDESDNLILHLKKR